MSPNRESVTLTSQQHPIILGNTPQNKIFDFRAFIIWILLGMRLEVFHIEYTFLFKRMLT